MAQDNTDKAGKARWGKRLLIGGAAVLSISIIGVLGVVQAGGGPGGMGFHGHGFGGPFSGPLGGRGLDRMLASVDATEQQRQEIRTIVDSTRAEVRPTMTEFKDRREQFAALLAAPVLDRAAFEALRRETLASADATSARALTAFLDAAAVLTPEQRAELLERRGKFGRGGSSERD